MGPIQNQAQFEKVKELPRGRPARTARSSPAASVLEREGYFVQPTIVRDIPDDARLVREEQFGPVLPVLRYSDIDDAIARANDTDFGLGGSVWSSDLDRAYAVAARIDAGTVWVNKHLDLAPDTPFARREAVRHRRRVGPGGTRGVHPGDSHQYGEMTNHTRHRVPQGPAIGRPLGPTPRRDTSTMSAIQQYAEHARSIARSSD